MVFLRKDSKAPLAWPLPGLATLWLVLRLVLSCCVPTLILSVRTRTYKLKRVELPWTWMWDQGRFWDPEGHQGSPEELASLFSSSLFDLITQEGSVGTHLSLGPVPIPSDFPCEPRQPVSQQPWLSRGHLPLGVTVLTPFCLLPLGPPFLLHCLFKLSFKINKCISVIRRECIERP